MRISRLVSASLLVVSAIATRRASALEWTQVQGATTTTQQSLAANVTDVWVIGTNTFTGNLDGNQVYQWDGVQFSGRSGGATRISVPSDNYYNEPWIITASGAIKKYD